MRYFLPLLLIVALLECPFNCMKVIQVGSPSAETSAGKCHCCSRHSAESETPPEETPGIPDDDCNCSNCLCYGAIGKSDQLDVAQLQLLNLLCMEVVRTDDIAATALASFTDRNEISSISPYGGLTARIALQSFQI